MISRRWSGPIVPMCLLVNVLASGLWASGPQPPSANRTVLRSPDGTIEVAVMTEGVLSYAVTVDGHSLTGVSKLGLRFHDGTILGGDVEVLKAQRTSAIPPGRTAGANTAWCAIDITS